MESEGVGKRWNDLGGSGNAKITLQTVQVLHQSWGAEGNADSQASIRPLVSLPVAGDLQVPQEKQGWP